MGALSPRFGNALPGVHRPSNLLRKVSTEMHLRDRDGDVIALPRLQKN